jgi:hypothetical protein
MNSLSLSILFAALASPAAFGQLSITFEELGPQPGSFYLTNPLTNQIPGATFAGPGALDGGAILDNSGNFGVAPHSGSSFLAFNRPVTMANGGFASDPEQITFAQTTNDVSIWAAGGFNTDTFTMVAFNSSNVQVGSAQVATQGWAQLRIQAPGIVRIRLTESNGDDAWIYDDLTCAQGNPVVTFCTSGTTTNGCVPSIAGTGVPSGSSGSGFTISVSSVEGVKQGLLFYGINNTGFTPVAWGPSTSFLCVKSPTQRSFAQNTGGTVGQCNGSLTLDWNAFVAANPGVLGSPFSPGQHVFAQGWFRDPPSPKTTMLSNALDFTLQ